MFIHYYFKTKKYTYGALVSHDERVVLVLPKHEDGGYGFIYQVQPQASFSLEVANLETLQEFIANCLFKGNYQTGYCVYRDGAFVKLVPFYTRAEMLLVMSLGVDSPQLDNM